jgi:hypothetical protein
MTSGSIANRVAGAFFCVWLAIAFAGSDYPPPPGFPLLAGMLLACALLVRLRVPTYLRWQREQARGRIARVIRDGAAGGAAAYVLLLVFGSGEPGVQHGLLTRLIGAGVTVALGIGNALVAYGIGVWFAKRERQATGKRR